MLHFPRCQMLVFFLPSLKFDHLNCFPEKNLRSLIIEALELEDGFVHARVHENMTIAPGKSTMNEDVWILLKMVDFPMSC